MAPDRLTSPTDTEVRRVAARPDRIVLAPRTRLDVPWCQRKLSVCGQRGTQTTAT